MTGAESNPVCAEVCRGSAVESRHRGAAVAVDPAGHVVMACGGVETAYPPRSAVKPLQALPLVETGAAGAFGLGDGELALACASHDGQPEAVAAVTAWLADLGLDAGDLACGAQRPTDPAAADDRVAAGLPAAGALTNMCSGKHAGFLTLARHLGAPAAGYTALTHPVQQRVLGVLETMTGLDDLTARPWGIDGCGVPTFAVPLGNLALAMARLADPVDQPEARAAACARLRRAMTAHPQRIAGRGRFDTRVIGTTHGEVLVKSGAEGVVAGCWPANGIGFAVKADDGAARAAEVTAMALLRRLGAVTGDGLADLARQPVVSRTGEVVGGVHAVAPLRP